MAPALTILVLVVIGAEAVALVVLYRRSPFFATRSQLRPGWQHIVSLLDQAGHQQTEIEAELARSFAPAGSR